MSTAAVPSSPRRHPHAAATTATTGTPRPVPQRPPLSVVPPRATSPARTPFAVLVFGLLTGGLVTLLLLNTALAQGSFRLTELQREASTLADRQQWLEQELARADTPQLLAERAAALGMVPARNPAFLGEDGQVLGVAKPGVAGTAPVAVPKPAQQPGAEHNGAQPDRGTAPGASAKPSAKPTPPNRTAQPSPTPVPVGDGSTFMVGPTR